MGFPGSSAGKESACNARDPGSIRWRRDGLPTPVFLGFPCGSVGKECTCNVGDLGLIAGLERSPGEFHGLYSPWDHKELNMIEPLSFHFTRHPVLVLLNHEGLLISLTQLHDRL